MVSRKPGAPRTAHIVTGVVDSVRRGLTGVLRWVTRGGSASAHAGKHIAGWLGTLIRGERASSPGGDVPAIIIGLAAVMTGSTIASLIEDDPSLMRWLLVTVVALMWAAARLAVVLIIERTAESSARIGLRSAWGLSLLPYAVAIDGVLYIGAWAISLLLLVYYLERLSIPGVRPLRTTLRVAGFEIAAAAAVWISGSLTILIPLW